MSETTLHFSDSIYNNGQVVGLKHSSGKKLGGREDSIAKGSFLMRKTDRRTQYTITVIKDAFIQLIKSHGYFGMTVTKLCREADIARSTFYLHFDGLDDVLNAVLDDALMFTDNRQLTALGAGAQSTDMDYLKENESQLAACQRVADSNKYHELLMDPMLSEYIVGRIIARERQRMVPAIQRRTGLSTVDAEKLFIYTVHGSFAMNKKNGFIKNDAWYHDLRLLNRFINSGYTAFQGDLSD